MNANKQLQAVLAFRLANQFYALKIENVIEVVAMMSLSTQQTEDVAVAGMVNRHGEAIPMLDLRRVFKVTASPPDESTLFIVAQRKDVIVGLIVDEIIQVKYIDTSMNRDAHGAGKYIRTIISDGKALYQQISMTALLGEFLPRFQA